MHSEEFTEAYPLDISEEDIHKGEYSKLISEAQDWSYRFGRRLHLSLTGGTPDTFTDPDEIRTYCGWGTNVVDTAIDLTGMALNGNHDALRAMNEFNFNLMNFFMRSMWEPIFQGAWRSEDSRRHCIQAAQLDLAVAGSIYITSRQLWSNKHGTAVWFDKDDVGVLTDTMNGILQEIDSAIVLLEVIKKYPKLTVMPAPVNFERMGGGDNVDFVVVDTEERNAIGAQVKTNLHRHTIRRANPRRVVFIDGTRDLCNVKRLRTRHDDDTERKVAWPGLIAVRLITQLPANKARRVVNRAVRARVRELAADVQVEIDEPARLIEQRIIEQM